MPVDEGPKAAHRGCATLHRMNNTRRLQLLALLGICAAVAAQTRDDLASRLSRRVVQKAPLSIPDRELVQVETEIPAGVESGWHIHPGEEVGYIVAGQVEMKVQGRATVVLKPGDGFLIPPRTPHNARDLGPETGRMLSSYLVESGQPLSTAVDPPAR